MLRLTKLQEDIIAQYNAGVGFTQISINLNCSTGSVSYALKKTRGIVQARGQAPRKNHVSLTDTRFKVLKYYYQHQKASMSQIAGACEVSIPTVSRAIALKEQLNDEYTQKLAASS